MARAPDRGGAHRHSHSHHADRLRAGDGRTCGRTLAKWLALGPQFAWAWNVLQWPLAFALVVAAIGSIYHFAPDTTHEWVCVTPGSVTAATLWLLVSLGFRMYGSHFANYQRTYGAIGGVMVALLWFYFTSLAILIGAQLDATIARASLPAESRGHLTAAWRHRYPDPAARRRSAMKPAATRRTISASIAHSGNVGTAVPIVSWKLVLVLHVVVLGSVTVTVIVATPERPSAPKMVSTRAPPMPLVITIAL